MYYSSNSLTHNSTLDGVQKNSNHIFKDSTKTIRSIFADAFRRDSFIVMDIFSKWILPTVCVTTGLGYLCSTSSGCINLTKLLIELIPLLDNPTKGTRSSLVQDFFYWVKNLAFILSLIFNCLVSPLSLINSAITAYFSVKILRAIPCLFNALFLVGLGLSRCQIPKDYVQLPRKSISSLVFVGEIFGLIEGLVEMLYYSFAPTMAVSLMGEHSLCVVSVEVYLSYVVCFRFFFSSVFTKVGSAERF